MAQCDVDMGATTTGQALRRRRQPRRWSRAVLHPSQVVVGSFALVILVGAVLLALPAATSTGKPLPLIDALFMAASGTCVTGLGVIDPGSQLSLFGQLVLLACIQIGGLGLMTLTTVFMVVTGRRLAISDRIAIQESYHHKPTGKLGTLILYIVSATMITELAGALLLFLRWSPSQPSRRIAETFYDALFHSISAFCNAGFSLYPENLARFQNDPYVLTVISGLIIAGGLGFLVGLDLKEYVEHSLLQRFWSGRVRARVEAIRPRPRLSVHTKFVLVSTAALLLIGTISYYLLERGRLFAGMPEHLAWWNAWFCSVTPRTAGFNSINYAAMSGPALLCTMVLMFIGGSPGSTAGGIKTSTFALLVANGIARWRGQERIRAFRRTIPRESVDKSGAVLIAAVATVVLGASVLMATEARAGDPSLSQHAFLPVLFETFSAYGTVGLSMGLTPSLSTLGKLVVIVLMFVGRIGPLTIALSLGTRPRRVQTIYAEENVMVG